LKVIKYIFAFMIFCISWLLISEMYVWYVSNFQSVYPYVTFYANYDTDLDVMKSDIKNSARDNDIIIFAVEHELISSNESKVNIYSTENVEDILRKECRIIAGSADSVLLGNTEICYKDWDDIPDISKIYEYHYIGDYDNAVNFKASLADAYGGKFPQDGYVTMNYEKNVFIIWLVSLSVIITVTLFQVAVSLKKISVEILMGQTFAGFIIYNIISDLIAITTLYIISNKLIGLFGNVIAAVDISNRMLAMFLIINSLIICGVIIIDVSKYLKTGAGRDLLSIGYIYKFFAAALILIIGSEIFGLISEGVSFYNQRECLLMYKDFSYCRVNITDDSNGNLTTNAYFSFYEKMKDEGKAVSLNLLEENYIYADEGALQYLSSEIPDANKINRDGKVYFLINEDAELDDIVSEWDMYCPVEDYEYEVLRYDGTANVVAADYSNGRSVETVFVKNPCIIVNTGNYLNEDTSENRSFYIVQSTMYDIDDAAWEEYIAGSNANDNISYMTNVYENYLVKWQYKKRMLILGIGLFTALILFDMLITGVILRMEMKINAVSIIVKKVQGRGIIYRYRVLFITAVTANVIGVIAAIIVREVLSLSVPDVLVVGITLLIMEMLAAALRVNHMEQLSIVKVLKGG